MVTPQHLPRLGHVLVHIPPSPSPLASFSDLLPNPLIQNRACSHRPVGKASKMVSPFAWLTAVLRLAQGRCTTARYGSEDRVPLDAHYCYRCRRGPPLPSRWSIH